MPAERLSMRKIRELLRLRFENRLPQRAIAESLGLSQGAISTYNQTFAQATQRTRSRWRLIVAFIAGTVVGLFNNFTQGVSASPLAIGFLVGYSVEVFFSFLDAFVHTFQRVRNPSPDFS
jgi:hypothetical protein